jgi:hypothetical protein
MTGAPAGEGKVRFFYSASGLFRFDPNVGSTVGWHRFMPIRIEIRLGIVLNAYDFLFTAVPVYTVLSLSSESWVS